MTYLDLTLRLPELLLMRVDKMTMAVGVEGRVPFLDHRLVELALSIPTAVLTRGGALKAVLKRAVRGVVPPEVIDRPKRGFGVPLEDWLRAGLGARVRGDVESFARRTGYLDADEAGAFVGRGKPSKVWQLWNLALWHRAYFEGGSR
jgi:asparagine synthase (glutamine-hydrolysing)